MDATVPKDTQHLARFILSGLTAFAAQVGMFYLLTGGFSLITQAAAPLSIAFAIVVSWLMQRTFTFRLTSRPTIRELSLFLGGTWLANLTNYVVFALLLHQAPTLPAVVSAAIACAPASLTAYLTMRFGAFAPPTGKRYEAAPFFIAFFLSWSAVALLGRYPGYVHFDAAEIHAWASLGFHGGYIKHPPLLPWIVGAIDYIVPLNTTGLIILGVLNITLAAMLVWRLATLCASPALAPLAVAFFMLSPYACWHGVKLNHNTILLSLWPAATLAFLLMLKKPTAVRGLMLGVIAAVSLYAKYSSALLLIAFAVAALATQSNRLIFKTAAPYAAATAFLLLIAPHLQWEYLHHFQTYRNADNPLSEPWSLPTRMLQENVLRTLPLLAVFCLFRWWLGPGQPSRTPFRREILTITGVLILLTVGLTAILGLRGSHSWTTPIYAFLPLVLIPFIGEPSQHQSRILLRGIYAVFVALPLISFILFLRAFQSGNQKVAEPIPEVIVEAAALWATAYPKPVPVIGGDHAYAVNGPLALAHTPLSWPRFSRALWWITPQIIKDGGAIILCPAADNPRRCNKTARAFIAEAHGWTCPITKRRALFSLEGKPYTVNAYFLPPAGSSAAKNPCVGISP